MPTPTCVLSRAGVKGGSAPKHKWTEEERAIVRRDYAGTYESARIIAEKLGVTMFAVKGQIQHMGITFYRHRPWSDDELETLGELVHKHSCSQVAKMMHRSPTAVRIKAIRLKLSPCQRDGWYTLQDVCQILGVDHKKVKRWIDQGVLTGRLHDEHAPARTGAMLHVEEDDLRAFIRRYPQELVGRNVDIIQIVDLLAGLQPLRNMGDRA